MFLTTEPSFPRAYNRIRIVHATANKGGQIDRPVKHTEEATEEAFGKLASKASALQADGVIGVQISVSTPGCVTVIGTAIKFI